ncbi:hypothetical protein C8R45DRAFT_839000 [Mycena sanguinolenta]|nr:hypothetical protein C8R45DRAFT_839000 [Mycena sanguinolenta]
MLSPRSTHPREKSSPSSYREPTPVVDADGLLFLCLGGFPDDPAWKEEVADAAAHAMEVAAVEIYSEAGWKRRAQSSGETPRRGRHHAKSAGPSMGGGQMYPQNLTHPARLLAIFAALFALKPFERLAGWGNMLLLAFAPVLHSLYRTTLDAVCDWDSRQQHPKPMPRNFALRFSVFSTATFNFGPATVTFPHIDFRNLAWGWCAITALGNFNPDRRGHLVLWDLKLIIRFPPGSTIFIPSAILRHSNTSIQPNETRFSFTQFTPAALFRWVYNRFRTDRDVDSSPSTAPKEHEQRRRDRARRWSEGIKMYRRWTGPTRSL